MFTSYVINLFFFFLMGQSKIIFLSVELLRTNVAVLVHYKTRLNTFDDDGKLF